MSWLDVVGHDSIIDRFRQSVACERLASTFLFVGPQGVGKRLVAFRLAQTMLCEKRQPDQFSPCGYCTSCQLVDAHNHPDLIEVSKPEDKSELPVELIIGQRDKRMQEGLCHAISLKPARGVRRVAILNDADFLNEESFNALLKILEEPPPKSLFILIGTSRERQLPTIQSRCQIVSFRPLSVEQIKQIIMRNIGETTVPADELALASRGQMNWAMLLSDPEIFEFRTRWLDRLAGRDPWDDWGTKAAMEFGEAAGADGAGKRHRYQLIGDLTLQFLNSVLKKCVGLSVEGDKALLDAVTRALRDQTISPLGICHAVEETVRFQSHIAANVQAQNALDAWLTKLSRCLAT